ncbi:BON domain-containing protein [Idiomarina aquatica]|jgi:hyperosmotically inducible protein|uniref:BON domain-containing protein n=1 Tax=Idiomarina aquatica TaxID=1327752 RepID=A0A4V3CPK4_9GAMM|nr:BON domain-containing protein [Idiomarina aquatica]MBL4742089.1 BON domain-containing protein [Idiomarina sp.]PHQ77286.1 MAG: hypothetical protein COB75_04115 [Idiomarina sp.]TDP38292.1 BON domain-containing protein [Idiomarina aquatica]
MKKMTLATATLLGLFTIAGCSQESADSKTEDAMDSASQAAEDMGEAAKAQMEQAGDYLSDAQITAKVKTALFDNGGIDSANVSVETRDGTVYLSGTLASDNDVETAGQLAAGVEGVEDVENDIVVGGN